MWNFLSIISYIFLVRYHENKDLSKYRIFISEYRIGEVIIDLAFIFVLNFLDGLDKNSGASLIWRFILFHKNDRVHLWLVLNSSF